MPTDEKGFNSYFYPFEGSRVRRAVYLGHPEFEGFEAIQTIKNPNARDQAA